MDLLINSQIAFSAFNRICWKTIFIPRSG